MKKYPGMKERPNWLTYLGGSKRNGGAK
jgi:hypothetical protein